MTQHSLGAFSDDFVKYGKNNVVAMKMHVDGLKRMVHMRGGLSKVRESSVATATIIHWYAN